ncbi:MAG: hypothetical protein K9L60_12390 [Methylovulum sp.]|nr:hypothetical protein [Methylovulum sp.]MCF7999818.1 hypothetical protein [Methylovulum sp.]
MKPYHLAEFREVYKAWVDELGNLLIELFHYVALFVIGASVVWSAVVSFVGMVSNGNASIGDILLLFIYLELGAMGGDLFSNQCHAGALSDFYCYYRFISITDC